MNVQTYLSKSKFRSNLNSLWLEKLEILMDISSTVLQLHDSGRLHENLHTNNVLRDDLNTWLSDLGLTHPPNELNPKDRRKVPECSNRYNLINFLPPEIVDGKKYTKESDVYCLGL